MSFNKTNNILGNVNCILPQELSNPFHFDKITSISIRYYKSVFDKEVFRGEVEFENGLTGGIQHFNGENLLDIYKQIYDFCNKLNNLKYDEKEKF